MSNSTRAARRKLLAAGATAATVSDRCSCSRPTLVLPVIGRSPLRSARAAEPPDGRQARVERPTMRRGLRHIEPCVAVA
jgi:hypothetical protein